MNLGSDSCVIGVMHPTTPQLPLWPWWHYSPLPFLWQKGKRFFSWFYLHSFSPAVIDSPASDLFTTLSLSLPTLIFFFWMHKDFTSVNLVCFLFHIWLLTCRLFMVMWNIMAFLVTKCYIFLEMWSNYCNGWYVISFIWQMLEKYGKTMRSYNQGD